MRMSGEKTIHLANGWGLLAVNIIVLLGAPVLIFVGLLAFLGGIIALNGYIALQPNMACLYTLFGAYVGTARESGFWWANPFRTKRLLSLRSRNFESSKLKVNDKQGNPIEIATVVVWR